MATSNKHQDWSIVAAKKFIRATRDSGYKSTSSAVSELVDNAVQARASKIEIVVEQPTDSNNTEIKVTDNGCGMDLFTLRKALRFGGSSRFNDRTGLGRFGMGLPNSSLSQARRVTVTSWTDYNVWKNQSSKVLGSGMPHQTYLDTNEIADGLITEVPLPQLVEMPSLSGHMRSGTIVHWTQCDRLDHKRTNTICRHLDKDLSRRFRYFLLKGTQITLNGSPIRAHDPLFINKSASISGAKPYGNVIHYTISSDPEDSTAPVGIVRVRFSELPVKKWAELSNDEKRSRGIINNAGASVVRANREVDNGWFFFGAKRKENYDDWWRCEIHFDPILDEAFGLTHTKQQIKPQHYLLQAIYPDIEATARVLNTRARKAHAALRLSRTPRRSESIAASRAQFLEPISSSTTKLQPNVNYEFREATLSDGQFFDFDIRRGKFILTVDPAHAFYRELYSHLRDDRVNSNAVKTMIELLLFSASRTEATMSSGDKDVLSRFRSKWSTTLETFLVG